MSDLGGTANASPFASSISASRLRTLFLVGPNMTEKEFPLAEPLRKAARSLLTYRLVISRVVSSNVRQADLVLRIRQICCSKAVKFDLRKTLKNRMGRHLLLFSFGWSY